MNFLEAISKFHVINQRDTVPIDNFRKTVAALINGTSDEWLLLFGDSFSSFLSWVPLCSHLHVTHPG